MSKPDHEFIIVTSEDKELLQQCIDLRIKVFVDEQQFPMDTEIDEYDDPDISVHLLLRLVPSLKPIGTVRLVTKTGKVGRLCLLPEYRKYGFGRQLMEECHAAALVKYRLRSTQLHSQMPVVPFYARLGYAPVGDIFDEEGAPHQKMVLEFSQPEEVDAI